MPWTTIITMLMWRHRDHQSFDSTLLGDPLPYTSTSTRWVGVSREMSFDRAGNKNQANSTPLFCRKIAPLSWASCEFYGAKVHSIKEGSSKHKLACLSKSSAASSHRAAPHLTSRHRCNPVHLSPMRRRRRLVPLFTGQVL